MSGPIQVRLEGGPLDGQVFTRHDRVRDEWWFDEPPTQPHKARYRQDCYRRVGVQADGTLLYTFVQSVGGEP